MMEKRALKNVTVEAMFYNNADKNVKYIVSSKTIYLTGEELLVTTFYNSADRKPSFRIFSNQTDFETFDYENGKWSDATLERRLDFSYIWRGNAIRVNFIKITYDSVDSMSCGSKYYDKSDDTVTVLDAFQQNIRKQQLNNKHEQQRNKIDALMSQVKPLPKNIQSWIDRVPLKYRRYIYYKRKGKSIHGYCTA